VLQQLHAWITQLGVKNTPGHFLIERGPAVELHVRRAHMLRSVVERLPAWIPQLGVNKAQRR
jgi:hypothetical protein